MMYNIFKRKSDYEDYNSKLKNLEFEKDLSDPDIRKIILKNIPDKYMVKEERSMGGKRINPYDIVIGEKTSYSFNIAGLEIKSDLDTFDRLPNQLFSYFYVFDNVFLVLHKKEIPKWLSEEIGIIRIFENGDIAIENFSSNYISSFEFGSNYDWKTYLKNNGISQDFTLVQKTLDSLSEVRKNLIVNRIFGEYDGFNTFKMKTFYPLREETLKFLIGFDVKKEYSGLKKDVNVLQRKLDVIKDLVNLGEK